MQRVALLMQRVALLRAALAATPRAARNQEWEDEIGRLLTEVVLFRLALEQEKELSSFVENK